MRTQKPKRLILPRDTEGFTKVTGDVTRLL